MRRLSQERNRYSLTSIKPPASPGADPESAWLKIIAGYRKPVLARSLYELAVTLIPFVLL
jgi:acyl-lipid omega-6 desaturase (Delta-12 desaturase)